MEGKGWFQLGVILLGCLCNVQGGTPFLERFTRKPEGTQAPVTARPTQEKPWSYRARVTQGPTLKKPMLTQAPVTLLPTYEGPKVPTTPVTVPTMPVKAPTAKPDAVRAECGESSVQLEVDLDLLGIGHQIQPSDITLGGCGPVEQLESTPVLLFETELHGCGSVLAMTEETLVYTFTLNYEPKALSGTPIIRTSSAVVGIQCQYMRLHNVSSNSLKPTWIPYYSTLTAEDLLEFSLRLMTDNWQMERESNVFFLGDLIYIEASVIQANHVPLRVFVDRCVATLDPNMNAVPRYTFIENKGCFVDSKLTSSRSQFLSRVQDDKLQFQLDAFRFSQETRSTMHIFCHLRATAALPDADGKACSYLPGEERWISASGNDEACSCCDGTCAARKARSIDSGVQYEGTAVLGPIVVQEAAGAVVPESHSSLKADHQAEGSIVVGTMAGVIAAVGLLCMFALVALLMWRH